MRAIRRYIALGLLLATSALAAGCSSTAPSAARELSGSQTAESAPDGLDVAFLESFAVSGAEAEVFTSYREMAQAADLVLHGVVQGVEPGTKVEDSVGYLMLRLKAVETFKGQLPADEVRLRILDLDYPRSSADLDRLMGIEAIFYLRSLAVDAKMNGAPVQDSYRELYRPINMAGLLANDRGKTSVPMRYAGEDFSDEWRGRSFDTSLQDTRAMAQG